MAGASSYGAAARLILPSCCEQYWGGLVDALRLCQRVKLAATPGPSSTRCSREVVSCHSCMLPLPLA